MLYIDEAKELTSKINDAIKAMNFDRDNYKELEVLFRLESIRGMLIIAHNDAMDLVSVWEKEG